MVTWMADAVYQKQHTQLKEQCFLSAWMLCYVRHCLDLTGGPCRIIHVTITTITTWRVETSVVCHTVSTY